MAPPSLLGPPELHKSSPTTTAPPPPEPESKPQGLELESPTRKASIWRRFGSTSTTPKLACNLPSFSEFGYFKDLPEIVYRLLESEDVRKKQKAEWRERKCTGRQEATGIRIRRRNRVELREEENRKKERKMESEEDDSVSEVLRDRFRLSTISIADAEAKRSGMEISESVVACISDLASKFTGLFALETWSNKQCQAFPKLEVGGGINSDNSLQYIEEGASHVIVTSYVFNNGQNLERLKDLVRVVGKERLVLDLSCRKREGKYAIVTDRWQKFSDMYLDKEILDFLAKYADEFLVHGVDVEGKNVW